MSRDATTAAAQAPITLDSTAANRLLVLLLFWVLVVVLTAGAGLMRLGASAGVDGILLASTAAKLAAEGSLLNMSAGDGGGATAGPAVAVTFGACRRSVEV
jgi:hypothetical protein